MVCGFQIIDPFLRRGKSVLELADCLGLGCRMAVYNMKEQTVSLRGISEYIDEFDKRQDMHDNDRICIPFTSPFGSPAGAPPSSAGLI